MKKTLKILVIVFTAAFLILQLFRPDRANPAVVETEMLEASARVPADLKLVLQRSCYDCHSNQTVYPWYSNVSPFSWFLDGHIEDGRRNLNFSVWNTYDTKKKIHKFDEICEMVEARAMPLSSYLWIHRDAALSDSDAKLLCDWATQERKNLFNLTELHKAE